MYKEFADRLIKTMKERGHTATRSPNGICIKTLAACAGASEQICRRYIRGDALPDYEKIKNIATFLNVSAGWLLFGESSETQKDNNLDENVLHYILKKSHQLYQEEIGKTEDYADFVLALIRDVKDIDTTQENLKKVIDLAMSSISLYEEKRRVKAV